MSGSSLKRKAEILSEADTSQKRFRQSFAQDGNSNHSKKYRPEYTEGAKRLAKVWEDLASEEKKARLEAATELVQQCEELINEPGAGHEDIKKIHTRLVKGLCSGRKAARLGFFTALTEVLRSTVGHEKAVTVQSFLDVISNTTIADTHPSGQEKRDYLIGHMSSYSALVNSLILFKTPLPSSDYTAVIEALCIAAQGTHWLREECGLSLCTAVRLLAESKCDEQYAKALIDILCSHNLAKTPEGVAVWLAVRSKFPDAALPHNVWPHQDPLYKKSLSTLANVFKQTNAAAVKGDTSETKSVQAGSRQMTPNFAWDHVIASFIGSDGSKESKQKGLSQFWTEVVDNGFFAATASAERKAVGFQILRKVIATAPDWVIGKAFSPKLLKCLINQSAKAERYLNKTAKALLDTIVARATDDHATAPVILAGLISSENGSINFDKLTGSKTLQTILQNADNACILQLVRQYTALLANAGTTDERAARSIRQSAADQLLGTVRGRYTKPTEALAPLWLQEILFSFAIYGYTTIPTEDKPVSPAMTSTIRDVLKVRLSSCLTHILSTQIDEDSTLPAMVVKCIADIGNNNEIWSQADPAVQKTMMFGLEVVSDLDSKALATAGAAAPSLRALKLLFCVSLIQAYSGEPDAVEMLNELQECYGTITSAKSGHDDNKEQAFGAVLEIILGFASKSSGLYRRLAEQVFTAITGQINAEALQSMLDVLAQDESLAGQQALFDQNGAEDEEEGVSEEGSSENDDSSEEDEDDSGDDDVEEVTNGDASEDEDDEDDDNDDEDDEEEDDDDADAQEIAEFEKLLASTLKTSLSTTAADNDNDEDTSDGEDMNDDEMMALEPSLAKIFQQRRDAASSAGSKKQEKKSAKETVVNFKNRVLDLLAIYVKQQARNKLAVALVLPLLRLARTTSSKQVAEKAVGVLRGYFDAAKSKGLPEAAEGEEAWTLLEKVHEEALLFASKAHVAAASRASLFVARMLLGLDRGNHGRIVEVYGQTQDRCFREGVKLPAVFWFDWINWSLSMAKS